MKDKDAIKVFLASSIDEFKAERDEIGCFFSRINNILIKQGVFVNLIMCENSSDAMVEGRMQDVYDEEIRSCDYLYVLFRCKTGLYTMEEFGVAYKSMFETGCPKTTVMFQDLGLSSCPTEEIIAFKNRLDNELKYPYTNFTSLDQVKLTMLRDMVKSLPFDTEIKITDAGVFVGGTRLAGIDPKALV